MRFIISFLCMIFGWSNLAVAMDIQTVPSEEGVETWLVENHHTPVVSLSFTFPRGEIDQKPTEYGVASFLEAMFDEGTGTYSSTEYQKLLEDKAMRLSVSVAGDYTGGAIYVSKKNLPLALTLYRQAMTDLRLEDKDLERMRQVLLKQLETAKTNPSWQARTLLNQEYFKGHPYGADLAGTPETVSALSAQDIRNFAHRLFQKGGVKLAIVGDVTKEEAAQISQTLFADLPVRSQEANRQIASVMEPTEGHIYQRKMDVPQSVIYFAHPSLTRTDKDWFALNILNYIVGGGSFNSRLMQEIRVKRGLTYGVSTSLDVRDYSQTWYGGVSTATATMPEVVALVQKTWQDIAENGVTAEEVAAAKSYISGVYYVSLRSNKDVSNRVAGIMRQGLGQDYFETRIEDLEKVTAEQVNRLAKKLMHEKSLTFAIVGNGDLLPTAIEVPLK